MWRRRVVGWSLAYSIAAIVNATILLGAFVKKFGRLATVDFAVKLAKILVLNLILF